MLSLGLARLFVLCSFRNYSMYEKSKRPLLLLQMIKFVIRDLTKKNDLIRNYGGVSNHELDQDFSHSRTLFEIHAFSSHIYLLQVKFSQKGRTLSLVLCKVSIVFFFHLYSFSSTLNDSLLSVDANETRELLFESLFFLILVDTVRCMAVETSQICSIIIFFFAR